METFYRGDTIELNYQLFNNKVRNEYWDLTDNILKIFFEEKLIIEDKNILDNILSNF